MSGTASSPHRDLAAALRNEQRRLLRGSIAELFGGSVDRFQIGDKGILLPVVRLLLQHLRAADDGVERPRRGLCVLRRPSLDLKRASDVTWLEPLLVAEVSYSELMEDRLWDPVLRELRVAR